MLSVLVPVYNVEQYLSRCISSILSQSYQDFELILVDDGSTDKSGQICDVYADGDPRVRVIHKKNGGLGSARIAGMEHASGEFVAFVDSDDYIECDMYKKLIAPFSGDPSIDISIGGYVIETNMGVISCPFMKDASEVYSASRAMIDMFENRKYNWSLCDKIYRRSLFEQGFLLSEWPRSYGEDTFVNWKIFQGAHNVIYQPVYAYHYCERKGSIMQSISLDKYLIYINIWKQIIKESNGEGYVIPVFHRMIEEGSRYIYEMQKEWERYFREIEIYRSILNACIIDFNCSMSKREQWRMSFINRSKEIWLNDNKEFYVELCNFVRYHSRVFIYGIGIIANDVATVMEKWKVEYEGFVISRGAGNIVNFHGKAVQVVDQLGVPVNSTGFILALNQKNMTEVTEVLISLGYTYSQIYLAGEKNFYYL